MFYMVLILGLHVFSYGADLDSDPLQENKEQQDLMSRSVKRDTIYEDKNTEWDFPVRSGSETSEAQSFDKNPKDGKSQKPVSKRRNRIVSWLLGGGDLSVGNVIGDGGFWPVMSDSPSKKGGGWLAPWPLFLGTKEGPEAKPAVVEAKSSDQSVPEKKPEISQREGKPSATSKPDLTGALEGEEAKPAEQKKDFNPSSRGDEAFVSSQGSGEGHQKENKSFPVTSRVEELGIVSPEEFLNLSYFGENSKLENTALGRAVAMGKREAYLAALAELKTHGIVGQQLLSVYHHFTSEGKTLLELMIRVPEAQQDFFTHELAGVLSIQAAQGKRDSVITDITFLMQTAQSAKNQPAFMTLSRLKKLLLEFEKQSVREKITALKEKKQFLGREYLSRLDSVLIKFPLVGVASLVAFSLPVEAYEFFVGLISEATGFALSSDLSSEAKVLRATTVGGGVLSGAYLLIHNSIKCMDVFSARKQLKKDITHSESYLKTL